MTETAKVADINCPYCDKPARFVSSREFYGRDYGTNLYVCTLCDARVGTHGRGKTPLGTLANGNLRNLRKMCHARIDPLWKSRKMSRKAVYMRLQKVMELTSEEAHIGMFNEHQCQKLIAIFERGEFWND
ncbi:zinc-finger-containing protein [Sporosarcina soli]|uniref:Zinc-finger-containing protein n=1 Tax=Sporosarcina soli TaxID=334736 RepID=A0ABW0TG37_9BACL